MHTPLITLDESGSLVDPYDIVVAVAWISHEDVKNAKVIISRAWGKFTTRKGKRNPIVKRHRLCNSRILSPGCFMPNTANAQTANIAS